MKHQPSQHLFCFGLGYSAQHFAKSLSTVDWKISGTVRTLESMQRLCDHKWKIFEFDGQAPIANAASILSDVTHLITSVPPDLSGDPVLRYHEQEILRLEKLEWVGYLSSTGVYGDRNGSWVDEESERIPRELRGKRRVDAENAWLGLWQDHSISVHLFRLAGIYGPGRNAIERVRKGRARRIVKPRQVFNRIHVEDIASVLKASINKPSPGRAYNLCDDEAAPPQEVIAFACELLGVAPPPETPFDEAQLSDMAQSFYRDNKRVSNARIKKELGVYLKWPTYREGLKNLAQ